MTKKVRIIDGMGSTAASPPTGAKHADFQSILMAHALRAGVLFLRADTLDFKVEAQPTPDNTVRIRAGGSGLVLNPAWTENSQLPKFFEIASDDDTVNEKVTVPANATGSTRADLVYAEVTSSTPNDYATNVLEFKILTAFTGTVSAAGVISGDSRLNGLRVIGLATLATPNAFSTIVSGNITDVRARSGLGLGQAFLPNDTYMKAIKAAGGVANIWKLGSSDVVVLDDTSWAHVVGAQHLNALSGTVQATADTSAPNASTLYDVTGAITPILTPLKTGVIRLKGFFVATQTSGSGHTTPALQESVNGGAYTWIGGNAVIGGPQNVDTVRRAGHVLTERTMTVGNTYRYKLGVWPDSTIARTIFAYGSFIDYDVIR